MQNTKLIVGSDKVIEVLGYWPAFHDAEIVSFSAMRAMPVEIGKSVARFAVHVRQYESVGKGTAQYELVLRKNVLIRFICNEACAFDLSDWNDQNVINSITASKIEGTGQSSIQVDIESIWGFGGSLQCSLIAVEAIEGLPLD